MIGGLVRRVNATSDVVRAAAAVLIARRIVATRPIGEFVGRSLSPDSPGSKRPATRALSVAEAHEVHRWATAVDRALRWLPGDPACLVRASALRALLAAHGVPAAAVRIGVQRDAGAFAAHAWVELYGTPIAEPVGLAGAFSSLDGVTLR